LSRIFLATIFLVIYGSLYPWEFHRRELSADPLWILFHSWPGQFGLTEIKDIVVNIALYAPLGMFGFLSFAPSRGKLFRIFTPISIGFLLSGCIEMLQLFDDGRVTSSLDLLTNTVGSAVGVVCGIWFQQYLQTIESRLHSIQRRQAGSMLLLICFGAYSLCPFFPDYGFWSIRHKLSILSASGFSVTAFSASLIEWLVIAKLVEAAVDPLWAPRILAALLILAPAKLLVSERTTTWSELSGVVAAYLIWVFALQPIAWRTQLLAVMFAALVLFRGLSPYHFASTASAFSWVPFRALFQYDSASALVVFLGKVFAYGTFVWILRESGWKMRFAAAAVVVLLAVIEAAQTRLPGRVAEITDPVLALILAYGLYLVDRPGPVTRLGAQTGS
jgi:VanZ family protein